MFGKVGFLYSLGVLFLLFLLARRIVHSPFGLSLRAIRNNPLRAAAIGIPVNKRLIAVYTLAAFYAGIAGALFTQTTALASLDVFSFERSADLMLVLVIGGTGYLYGGLIGAVVFRMLQEFFSNLTPQYWQFWIGLVLVVIVLVGRQRLHRAALWAPNLVIRLFGGGKTGIVEAVKIGEDTVFIGKHQLAAPGGLGLGASAGAGAATLYLPMMEPSNSAGSISVVAPPSGSDETRLFCGPGLRLFPARKSAIIFSVIGPSMSS